MGVPLPGADIIAAARSMSRRGLPSTRSIASTGATSRVPKKPLLGSAQTGTPRAASASW